MTDPQRGTAQIVGAASTTSTRVLTPEALDFVSRLHREFNPRREQRLAARADRRARIEQGESLDFLADTAAVRQGDWRVAPAPRDLEDRRVEITGPTDRKMMINALNSGARVFMADLEDATSPTWANVVDGQAYPMVAVRRLLAFDTPDA
jgi:malate synthase